MIIERGVLMNQNEEYIEINLKAIFFRVLYQWKKLLVWGIVIGMLLGGFMAFSEYRVITSTEQDTTYHLELQEYQEKLALAQGKVDATQVKINALQEYMDHAVLMKADYRNIYISKATYYIDSNYQIMPSLNYQNPDKTYSLAWYYQNFLSDYTLYQEIGEEIGIEAKYLMDLIDIVVANGNTLFMTVSHPTEQFANQIMEILQEKLYEIHEHLNDTIDRHSLTLMLDTCGNYVDESLRDRQQEVYDEMLGHQSDLIKLKEELQTLEEEPPKEANVLKAFIKWFILGGVLGAMIPAGISVCGTVFRDCVYSSEDLTSRYQKPVFGYVLRQEQNMDPLTSLIRKWEHIANKNSKENNAYLAANLRNHLGSSKNILLCSDVSEAESALAVDALQALLPEQILTSAGSLTNDVNALEALSHCEAVIAVVSASRSHRKEINRAISTISGCGKTLAGFIWID